MDCFINNNTIQNTSVASGTVYGNGLYLANSLVILSNCVVKANSCSAGNAQGGGLYMSGGTTTVWGTTIALNQLSYIYTRQGGGVYNNGGTLILRNSLVVGNGTTGGTGDGIYTTGASKTFLENCTVADNAGQGIHRNNGTISATNCIIWGNGADLVGSPISVAYCNIQKDHASWTNEVNGCISQDPGFDRGYYLAADSPCVNAGTNDASFWELGALTTQTDGTPDAGRVNLGYHYASGYDSTGADLFVSASGTDATGTNWAEAFQTVTRALSVARDGSVIHLDSGTYSITSGETFPLSQSGRIGLKIEGSSQTGTVINAAGSGQRVLTLQDCANVEISDLTLTGGTNAINGNVYAGGLYLSGCGGVRLLSVAITDNIARNTNPASGDTYGGGIYAAGGTLTLSNCVVSGNSALGGNSSGGGICAQNGGVLELYDTVVSNNKGSTLYTRKGGGVYNKGLGCRFRNCLVVGNSMTSGSGGGLYQESSGSMILENCTVADNTGGGIYRTANAPVSLTNCIVWGHVDDLTGTMSVSYCNIQTTDTFWTNGVNGCISQDPSFDRGYYLAGNSPCVNAGTNDASTWGLDTYSTQFDGTPDSGRVDLGYHYRPDSVTALSYDYYVATNGLDTHSGTNWAEAFQTVTKAFTMVQDGVTIHIGTGNFSTNSGEVFPLTLANRIGIRVEGASRAGTVLNAAGSGQRVMTLQDCSNVEISNLTLTGGSNAISGSVSAGGLYLSGGAVRLVSVAITNNVARNTTPASGDTYGGGIYTASGALVLSNCVVSGNSALGGNSSGGGLCAQNGGVLELYDTVVSDNRGSTLYTRKGGGVYNDGRTSRFRNCLVVGNAMTSGYGGGLYQESSGSMTLENCTVADNTGGGIYRTANAPVSLTNCIVWGHVDDLTGTMAMEYSLSGNESYADIDGNISIDPLFVDAAGGDYRLANGSPAAKKGITQAWMTNATDLDGNPRIQSGKVDMGAYESAMGSGTMFLFR